MTEDHKSIPKETGDSSICSRRLRLLFFGALALLVIINVFLVPHHPHFGLEKIPGFWAAFGLLGAVILGRAAKGLAHTFLGRDEDFYDKTTSSQEKTK